MMKAKYVLLFLLSFFCVEINAAEKKTAVYEIEYGAKVTRYSGKFGSYRLGLPVFMNNAFQKVIRYSVSQIPSQEIVSIPHTLKYLYFNSGELLNKNRITEFKITLQLEKINPVIQLDKLPWKAYNKNSGLYVDYTKKDAYFQTGHPYAQKIASQSANMNYPDKIRFIFNHVRKNLRYNAGFKRYRSFAEILATRGGDCSDYSTFFVTLLRASGIPARNVTGRIINPTLRGTWHAWTEFYSEGFGWVPCDPANLEISDNNKLIGYMPLKYISVHTGVNIPLPSGENSRSLPVIQTYFYFYSAKRGEPYPRFSFDFIWKIKNIR